MRYNIALLSILATIGLLCYPWRPGEQAIASSSSLLSERFGTAPLNISNVGVSDALKTVLTGMD
jgi:hypothetical protein